MRNNVQDKDPVQTLHERLTKLEADFAVSCMKPEDKDMVVKYDPPKSPASFKNQKLSTIRDDRYLFDLANFLDWTGFKDAAKGEGTEDRRYAKYRHLDAARVRAHKASLPRTERGFVAKKKRAPEPEPAEDADVPF